MIFGDEFLRWVDMQEVGWLTLWAVIWHRVGNSPAPARKSSLLEIRLCSCLQDFLLTTNNV